jgi:uncharacterized phage-associated protein
MPGWSPEIANEFIRLAAGEGRLLNQVQLQGLTYVAHGRSLALSGEPLTGDRPEAWDFGPVYRRLADALRSHGLDIVDREILTCEVYRQWAGPEAQMPASAELDQGEMELIANVYRDFAALGEARLFHCTSATGSAWAAVFADGAGEFREITHKLIKAQFLELTGEVG